MLAPAQLLQALPLSSKHEGTPMHSIMFHTCRFNTLRQLHDLNIAPAEETQALYAPAQPAAATCIL